MTNLIDRKSFSGGSFSNNGLHLLSGQSSERHWCETYIRSKEMKQQSILVLIILDLRKKFPVELHFGLSCRHTIKF